jgi:hypothetical protein
LPNKVQNVEVSDTRGDAMKIQKPATKTTSAKDN